MRKKLLDTLGIIAFIAFAVWCAKEGAFIY